MISSWSHSKHGDFAKCKFLCYLKHDQKIPEPPRPLPPGKTEHANDRGTRIHDSAEKFVNGTGPFIPELKEFEQEFLHLKHLYAAGKVSLEGEWAHDKNWDPCSWSGDWETIEKGDLRLTDATPSVLKKLPPYGKADQVVKVGKQLYIWVPAWLRLKLDALVHASATEAVVIDYKSGKKFGNEIKHAEQTQLYALSTFIRYPELEVVHAELWYVDVKDLTRVTYLRDQALRFRRSWEKRGNDLVNCTEFPPNPNIFSCQWCPYGPWGTGHCKVGVKR